MMTNKRLDIWMPLYIGDYLADTMDLQAEQHGAYLLLLFHLWRRDTLPDDDVALALIARLEIPAWRKHRAILAKYFQIHDGVWTHTRIDRERARLTAVSQVNETRAKKGAAARWNKPKGRLENAPGIPQALPDDAKSESQSQSEPQSEPQSQAEPNPQAQPHFFPVASQREGKVSFRGGFDHSDEAKNDARRQGCESGGSVFWR